LNYYLFQSIDFFVRLTADEIDVSESTFAELLENVEVGDGCWGDVGVGVVGGIVIIEIIVVIIIVIVYVIDVVVIINVVVIIIIIDIVIDVIIDHT
jgi:hypothetical protein